MIAASTWPTTATLPSYNDSDFQVATLYSILELGRLALIGVGVNEVTGIRWRRRIY